MKIYIRAAVRDVLDESKDAQLAIINDPHARLRPADFLRLAKSRYADVKAIVAKRPDTPPEILDKLAKDKTITVRKAVCENPNVPLDTMIRLLHDDHDEVCRHAHWNTSFIDSLTPEALTRLAEDKWPSVRRIAAEHKNTPPEVLAKLTQDPHEWTAKVALKNPNTPEDALVRFSEGVSFTNTSDRVSALVCNPSTPSAVLAKIYRGEHNPSLDPAIAENPNTPPEILVEMSSAESQYQRAHVACNPSTPIEVLEILANDPEPDVVKQVAGNPSAPAAVLIDLANNEDYYVRYRLCWNPNLPESLYSQLAHDPDDLVRVGIASKPNLPVEDMYRLAKDESTHVKSCLAKNPNLPSDILDELARADYSDSLFHHDIYQHIAENPNTSNETLHYLIDNSQRYDDHLRELAKKNPNYQE